MNSAIHPFAPKVVQLVVQCCDVICKRPLISFSFTNGQVGFSKDPLKILLTSVANSTSSMQVYKDFRVLASPYLIIIQHSQTWLTCLLCNGGAWCPLCPESAVQNVKYYEQMAVIICIAAPRPWWESALMISAHKQTSCSHLVTGCSHPLLVSKCC